MKKVPHISEKIQLSQPQRFGLDIEHYKSAIRQFENVYGSRRALLYDLYNDILSDPHLTSVIERRMANVCSAPVAFRKNDGTPDERIQEVIDAPWFSDFLRDALYARFWGFSFFQFDVDRSGWITYELVNRKHVDPQHRCILPSQYDTCGPSFDTFYNTLLVGRHDDLGLLAKAAPYVIYKRNCMGDWSQFAELFGMPIREYTYDAADDEARMQVLHDAQSQGSAQVFIHPDGSGLNFIDSGSKQQSSEVYQALTERCNAEISKLFLTNTLSTESSENGTQALGTVQKKGEDSLLKADRKYVLNVLNYDMTDLFNALGVNTSGGSFIYEKSEDVDLDQQLRIVQGLSNIGLDIPQDYLYEKFGIEKPSDNSQTVARKPSGNPQGNGKGGADDDEPTPSDEEKKGLAAQLSHWISFFDKAPRRKK